MCLSPKPRAQAIVVPTTSGGKSATRVQTPISVLREHLHFPFESILELGVLRTIKETRRQDCRVWQLRPHRVFLTSRMSSLWWGRLLFSNAMPLMAQLPIRHCFYRVPRKKCCLQLLNVFQKLQNQGWKLLSRLRLD